jgi:hypothetical protein
MRRDYLLLKLFDSVLAADLPSQKKNLRREAVMSFPKRRYEF